MSSIRIPLLGIFEIDEQHAKLIACVERLELWEGKGQGFAALLDALQALSVYAQEHFSYEEDFMRRYHYPNLDRHIAEHQEFSDELSRLTERVLDGESASEPVIAFVRDWVTTHISQEDMRFAACIPNTRRS